ncbi:AAA family ATPase [Streptomyces iconiensis]|uniref:AAA family ATPase n=1 Tax=Streptomyces iconiensis TaxID=1384038 RepID=A0ABT6ZZW0_9ACTN|nr:AAA family ATPase [Streptomyces iconiensis]MDJ1134596.1 AAA family ATPase [Streptomyces iconiensis]
MVTRIQPAVSDPDAARSVVTLLSQLPDCEPVPPAIDSTQLLDTLTQQAAESLADLPEVVLVHELIGPLPALELIREVALRFPAVGVILATQDTSPSLFSAAMDAGARGVAGLPLSYDELAARVGAASGWSSGVRRHLEGFGGYGEGAAGAARNGAAAAGNGLVVAVTGAKGGVGVTLTAVQLALAARASGRNAALVDMDLQAGDVASYLDVQFRRSVADLAGIRDISPRVLQDAVYTHESGLGLLLAPGEGERGEEVDERAARQIINAMRARFEVVVIDCGTQMHSANAAVVEMADSALLLTTPDVVSVRGAKRMVRLWERLQVRKAEETLTVVNRASRHTEIQPQLIARITGTLVAGTTVPANFKELQSAVDAGRMQDLDPKGTVRQALWSLAGELGLVAPGENGAGGRGRRGRQAKAGKGGGDPAAGPKSLPEGGSTSGPQHAALPPGPSSHRAGPPSHRAGARFGSDRGAVAFVRRRLAPPPQEGGDRGSLSVEFAGMAPLVLVVLTLLWQCVLIGYTFSLAGNAADEAARAATGAAAYGDPQGACESAAREHLPAKWRDGSTVSCALGGNVWKADVDLKTPILFPGAAGLPFTVNGEAGAAEEG